MASTLEGGCGFLSEQDYHYSSVYKSQVLASVVLARVQKLGKNECYFYHTGISPNEQPNISFIFLSTLTR